MISLVALVVLLGGDIARASSSASEAGAGPLELLQAPQSFGVEWSVLLNDAARKDKEVGFRLTAALRVQPAWADERESLLRFELLSPQLHSRGKHVNANYFPRKSVWDSHSHSVFYAHWKQGVIENIYLEPDELIEIQNFKRSLVSLFQFQVFDGETKETDISGTCDVHYETVSPQVIRKFKWNCISEGWSGDEAVSSRRLARYSLSAARGALDELFAEELHALQAGGAEGEGGEGGAGVKARSWLRLSRAAPPPAAPRAPSLVAALEAVPSTLVASSLRAPPPAEDDEPPISDAELAEAAADAAALAGGEAGAGGDAASARAALRLPAAVRRARLPQLTALLHAAGDAQALEGLLGALALAGGAAAHAAAARFLQLREGDAPAAPARAYLAALATAPAPQASTVEDVLRLGEELADSALAHGALLAAAAAARAADRSGTVAAAAAARAADRSGTVAAAAAARAADRSGTVAAAAAARAADRSGTVAAAAAARAADRSGTVAAAARDALAKTLAKCKDDECRIVRIHALGNLRREDTIELLLEYAERDAQDVALAALDALRAAPAALVAPARLRRLERLALGAAPLAVRAAALDLLLERSAAAPFHLAPLLLALRAAPHELRRVAARRLDALAAEHEAVRALLRVLPREPRGWDERALAGTSGVLVRELRGAGAAGRWRARLDSVQLARGGALRRGIVRLTALSPRNESHDVLSVELWTRGLESFTGGTGAGAGEGEGEGEAEATRGGLALTVGGARVRTITLFDGQAELLGHVWGGAGSEPTRVLRAARPLPPRAAALPLLGGAALALRADAALALALDAQAQVSLWSRSARSLLELRGALLARARARVAAAGAELSAHAELLLEPRLRIAADLDFYDGVALCVRVSTDDHALSSNVTLESEVGAARARVRRERGAVWAAPGRTLALGAPNDAVCSAMAAH